MLLEYFSGEKPLRMSQISRKIDLVRFNYCELVNPRKSSHKIMFDARETFG